MNEEVNTETSDSDFLFDLADRLMRVATPAIGFDQADTERLCRIARDIVTREVVEEGAKDKNFRDRLYKLIQENLTYSSNTEKLRWIMDANGWQTAEDVRDNATDGQVEAFFSVWGVAAYTI